MAADSHVPNLSGTHSIKYFTFLSYIQNYNPFMNLENLRPRYFRLVPWYKYGSPLSTHTKKYKHPVYDFEMTS